MSIEIVGHKVPQGEGTRTPARQFYQMQWAAGGEVLRGTGGAEMPVLLTFLFSAIK
jgi:hypothetical protein